MNSAQGIVSKAMEQTESRKALSFDQALMRPLTAQYHAPGNWLLFAIGKSRAVHFGTFVTASLSNMDTIIERLQLTWNAAAGKTNDQLRAEINDLTSVAKLEEHLS